MSAINAKEILGGFRLGYHGGWDETELTANQVVVLEHEAAASKRQLEAAARKGLLGMLAPKESPEKDAA